MRKFCMVNPKVWTDYLRKFPDDVKTVYLYLCTSRHQTLAGGCYLPLEYAVSDIGWDSARVKKAIEWLDNSGYITLDNETDEMFVSDWFDVNFPTSSKVYKGVIREIENWTSASIKSAALTALEMAVDQRGEPNWMSEAQDHRFPTPKEALENLGGDVSSSF